MACNPSRIKAALYPQKRLPAGLSPAGGKKGAWSSLGSGTHSEQGISAAAGLG